jgi:HK97 family phage major capsid protein
MNSTSMAYLYGLEDGVSRPLMQPDLTAGFGFRMMGRPIVDFVDLPDPGAGTFPVYFGDLAQAYTVLMRKSMTLLRDPYSSWPWVLFKVSWRVGGKTVFPEAMNRQECAVS